MNNILFYTDARAASENDDFPTDFSIFIKALRTADRLTNGQTNQPLDQPTTTHRRAIAAAKKG